MNWLTENLKCEIPNYHTSCWALKVCRFKFRPSENSSNCLEWVCKESCYNQQQTQGVKNFKWQLGAAQAALQLLQRALFVAHSLCTLQWIHNAANWDLRFERVWGLIWEYLTFGKPLAASDLCQLHKAKIVSCIERGRVVLIESRVVLIEGRVVLIEGRVVLITSKQNPRCFGNFRHISRESQNLSASTEIAEVKTYVLCCK